MKAKALPQHRITPARDPLLDGSRWENTRDEIKRWALGLALVLALALLDSLAAGRASAGTIASQVEQLDERDRRINELEQHLAVRRASGTCQTLFYLVEAEDLKAAGEKLSLAAMQVAGAANKALYPPR